MLTHLLGNIAPEYFFSEYWNKKHVRLQSHGSIFPSFSKESFFDIIYTCNLAFPQLTCLNAHGQVPVEQYISITPDFVSAQVVADNVKKLAESGTTVRIKGVGRFRKSLHDLKEKITKIFSCPITMNAYYSSAPAGGISPHYDIRHTFIIQLEGTKQWNIGSKIAQTPREDYKPYWNADTYNVLTKFDLQAGQVLYLPPGLWHHTQTLTPHSSLHLALGVALPDWYDALKGYIMCSMQQNPILREHIPFYIKDNAVCLKKDLTADLSSLLDFLKDDLATRKYLSGLLFNTSEKS